MDFHCLYWPLFAVVFIWALVHKINKYRRSTKYSTNNERKNNARY